MRNEYVLLVQITSMDLKDTNLAKHGSGEDNDLKEESAEEQI